MQSLQKSGFNGVQTHDPPKNIFQPIKYRTRKLKISNEGESLFQTHDLYYKILSNKQYIKRKLNEIKIHNPMTKYFLASEI